MAPLIERERIQDLQKKKNMKKNSRTIRDKSLIFFPLAAKTEYLINGGSVF